MEPNYIPENIPIQLNLQLTSDSYIDEATLAEENPTGNNTHLAESTGLLREEEIILPEVLPKFKDDDVTATMVDKSLDEMGSIVSDIKPVADSHPFCSKADTWTNIRGEETMKERGIRLLRQHR